MDASEIIVTIVVALIGGGATILGAMISKMHRVQREFREESSAQHGTLYATVQRIETITSATSKEMTNLSNAFHAHLQEHEDSDEG